MSRKTSLRAKLKGDSDNRRIPAGFAHHFRELAHRAARRRQDRDDEIRSTRMNTRGLPVGTCRFDPDEAQHRRTVRLKNTARKAARRELERKAAVLVSVLDQPDLRSALNDSAPGVVERFLRRLGVRRPLFQG